MKSRAWFLACFAFVLPPAAKATVFAITGLDAASVTPTRDLFRLAIGGGASAGANGSFGGLRREINWDGVPAISAAPNLIAANFFNTVSPRGVVFSTPGTGFEVSGTPTDAGAGQPAAANFGDIDPTYTATFAPFSIQRLFTPRGSNITDINFFLAGTSTPGYVTAFGAMFSDVNASGSTMEFFDASNNSLGAFAVPSMAGAQTLSFLGVTLNPGQQAVRVRITSGTAALGFGVLDGPPNDLAVMDDWIYSEPASTVPEPATWMTAVAGTLALWLRRRVSQRH